MDRERFNYYNELVAYRCRTKKGDCDAYLTIMRMTNNPNIIAEQRMLEGSPVDGLYVIVVTRAVMDTMKKVVDFIEVTEEKDENDAYFKVRKEKGSAW